MKQAVSWLFKAFIYLLLKILVLISDIVCVVFLFQQLYPYRTVVYVFYLNTLIDCSLCVLNYKRVCVNKLNILFLLICQVKSKTAPLMFYGNCDVFLMTH